MQDPLGQFKVTELARTHVYVCVCVYSDSDFWLAQTQVPCPADS